MEEKNIPHSEYSNYKTDAFDVVLDANVKIFLQELNCNFSYGEEMSLKEMYSNYKTDAFDVVLDANVKIFLQELNCNFSYGEEMSLKEMSLKEMSLKEKYDLYPELKLAITQQPGSVKEYDLYPELKLVKIQQKVITQQPNSTELNLILSDKATPSTKEKPKYILENTKSKSTLTKLVGLNYLNFGFLGKELKKHLQIDYLKGYFSGASTLSKREIMKKDILEHRHIQ